MIALLLGTALAAAAAVYSWVALLAQAVKAPRQGGPGPATAPGAPAVTVLKPLHGDEPGLEANLRSFCVQSAARFQILCGVQDPHDAAVAVVRRLQAEFPTVDLQLVVDPARHGLNHKVSNLINLYRHADHDWLVIADSDIWVPPDYLAAVTRPLSNPAVGLVTCLYRAVPRGGFWSLVGISLINDWFAPSVRVSHLFGSRRFAFGATLALRRATLDGIGGLEAVKDVVADDYWLGELIRRKGLGTVLSEIEVTTDVAEKSFSTLWEHELRWFRTIRSVEPAGFAFTFITFTTPIALLGAALARNELGCGLAALALAWRLFLYRQTHRRQPPSIFWSGCLLLPLRDCLSLAEWGAAHLGSRVVWREQVMDVAADVGFRQARPAPAAAPRGVILTADDFGLHPAVNAAVETAHVRGVLTAASLMVAAPAAADAIARARRLPDLRVGLHLVLADGLACLPAARIPDLVGPDGRFGSRMARDGCRFFFLPRVRRQLADEIRAQFAAFAATGLKLDHVNAHKHFHLHPTVLSLILEIGADYGLRAVRLPAELPGSGFLRPWTALMARRLQAAGVACNGHVIGLAATGAMDEAAVLRALAQLPEGITELYFHPATISGAEIAATMAGYRHEDELHALVSPRVRAELERQGLPRGGFADLLSEKAPRGPTERTAALEKVGSGLS